jgi:ABC-type transporter Mla subunit MlaD
MTKSKEALNGMTGEEMERAIEFLLKNQADFEARFEAEREQTNQQIRDLAARDQQTREFLDELSRIVAQNSQDIERNSQLIERNSQLIERSSQQIERNSQQISHLGNIVGNMAEGQNRRDEEIDALFKLVGGLIERKNGKAES